MGRRLKKQLCIKANIYDPRLAHFYRTLQKQYKIQNHNDMIGIMIETLVDVHNATLKKSQELKEAASGNTGASQESEVAADNPTVTDQETVCTAGDGASE